VWLEDRGILDQCGIFGIICQQVKYIGFASTRLLLYAFEITNSKRLQLKFWIHNPIDVVKFSPFRTPLVGSAPCSTSKNLVATLFEYPMIRKTTIDRVKPFALAVSIFTPGSRTANPITSI
jgi:hypothetical protein